MSHDTNIMFLASLLGVVLGITLVDNIFLGILAGFFSGVISSVIILGLLNLFIKKFPLAHKGESKNE
ncbi:hypothetical protein LCGC14_1723990 [marine sediment metagenome]|uniref:Uncharacterized protein n=1 Tax=marine sediment metagenome TaxID=412755 RepID=A0A0F9HZD0_9ZZZZ